jgi:peptide-methionine (S)-S-oxide reductase
MRLFRLVLAAWTLAALPAWAGGTVRPADSPGGKAMATETITLGGGCFWCMEAVFQDLKGVVSVQSGYSGGSVADPTYREVCTGRTGHAEVVQIAFDPAVLSLHDLLEVFFALHDPTTLNRQGADVGTQYRSVIFYRTPEQKETAKEVIRDLTAKRVYDAPIVTEVQPFKTFYKAEDCHQNYYRDNPDQPYCQLVISPKLSKFRKLFKPMAKQ